ncbi:MAG: phosphomannomutase/phosphoglucomutase [Alphaproteobacteria bacterium]|nr:phosphomannomutase/phosphoglucomutase [Alphaproteobacteria bacterium]
MPPAAYNFDPEILREYDIRGIIGKNLSETDAYYVGLAFATYVRRKTGGNRICLGFDGRHSSPALQKAMVEGMMTAGIAVERVGLGPTPMLYFAVKDRKADAGLMITGSHNPGNYNGFKMTLLNAPVFGEAVQEIGRIAAAGDYELGQGTLADFDIQDAYVDRLVRDTKLVAGKSMKIAWDCGNGAAGEIVRRLTKKLPGEHILMYDKIDGDFPNHHPDPTVDKNLADIIKVVREQKCDLGLAFDGDGDRVGAVDEKGNILRCDLLITLYARDVLKRHPGATIIGDVKCSQVMFDEINKMGGKGVMWKTGHSLIKAKMAETNAPLAGELSGHIFFKDGWYGFDDGMYCSIRLIDVLVDAGKPLSVLTDSLPKIINTPEVRFEVDEKEKFSLVSRLVESVKNIAATDKTITVDDIDGARVNTPDGWWLVRASNTQNVLVMRAEAQSDAGLDRIKAMIVKEMAKIGQKPDFEAGH